MSAETQGPDAATMEAGREMDAAIAERVMGAVWMNAGDPDYELLRFAPEEYTLATRERATGRLVSYGEAWDDECLPYYSTEIAAAWEVVEAMRARWAQQVNAERGEPDVWQLHDYADEGWRASVVWLHHDGAITEAEAMAPTLPLAICRAALMVTPTGPRAPGE